MDITKLMQEQVNNTVVLPSGAEIMEAPLTRKGQVGLRYNIGSFLQKSKKRHKMQNPIAANQADVTNWIFWDKLAVAAGVTTATSYTLFVNPISATKGKSSTNLESPGKLQAPQILNVFNLGFIFRPDVYIVDLAALLDAYWVEFWVGQKSYAEGLLYHFPGGAGVQSSTSGTTNLGWPVAGNEYDLRLPAGMNLGSCTTDGLTGIMILQDQAFKVYVNSNAGVSLTAATTGTGWNMTAHLKGILSRAVQ